ncbi:unnamed protein product [Prorocentrum cordatum]|uniref:Uncharacterized protein n=1 Tax=Prorocentrum cordatum TaxID=2364126 RepID=A0ABN9R5F2_9DINO|nr:unnamed protein product [Polarella glacialis]
MATTCPGAALGSLHCRRPRPPAGADRVGALAQDTLRLLELAISDLRGGEARAAGPAPPRLAAEPTRPAPSRRSPASKPSGARRQPRGPPPAAAAASAAAAARGARLRARGPRLPPAARPRAGLRAARPRPARPRLGAAGPRGAARPGAPTRRREDAPAVRQRRALLGGGLHVLRGRRVRLLVGADHGQRAQVAAAPAVGDGGRLRGGVSFGAPVIIDT